ncbi:MAG: hypothetical protein ACP5JO_02620 [Candidatus Ratteibacteria bacterium]
MQKQKHSSHPRPPKYLSKISSVMGNVAYAHQRLFFRRLESRKGR